MDRRNNLLVDSQKPEWDWLTVECTLRTSEDGKKNSIWQLAPSIFLTTPTSSGSDPKVKLFIDTEKSLNYSPELGWNWHKSWNLPNISVKLEIKDQAGEQLLSPKNLYAQIFAVKKAPEAELTEKMTLLDVGIRGESKMQMIDGHVYFSAMKFSSTTYNNEGHNFHLLVVISIHENPVEKPKVLTAVISPEIFVDSRRAAREYQERKFNSFVEPFSFENIEKEFVKRESKSKIEQETAISNDSQGFYNYLTAPNIRHKVKHPLFLAIRFSSCVSFFYNKSAMDTKQCESDERKGIKDIFEVLQKKLLKECQGKVKQQADKSLTSERSFLFVVENLKDSLKRKKVMESLQLLSSPSIEVIEDIKEIPNNFMKMQNIETLVSCYKEIYESLKEMCKKYLPFDASSSDEESLEDPVPKKMKVSKFEGGVAFICNSSKKRRQANIVCKTIHTKDVPRISQTQEKPFPQPQKQPIKKQDEKLEKQVDKFDEQQNPAPSKKNLFSLNIGKGSAFNNIREQKPKEENFRECFPQYPANNVKNGLPNQNFQFPGNGMNYNGFGMNNMNNMNNMNSMNGMNNMNNNFLGGMGGLGNFSGLNNMGVNPLSMMGMNNYQNLTSAMNSNMGNLAHMNMLNNLAGQNNSNPMMPSHNEAEQKNVMESLLHNNLMLSNWLSSVRNNNRNLVEASNHRLEETIKEVTPEVLNKNITSNQDYLLQQINLYRELLNHITLQNQLLGRNLAQVRMDGEGSHPQDGNIHQINLRNSFMNNGLSKPKEQSK